MKSFFKVFARGFGIWAAVLAAGTMFLPAPAVAGDRTSGAVTEARLEIDDPSTGLRWLLVRDEDHPGGPGRLVRLEPAGTGQRPGAMRQDGASGIRPTIRTGDRIRLEEHTPVADAVLDCVALGPALPGAPLKVRLKIGGQVVRAIAVAPGRAVLAMEKRP